ncbi:CRISPR-associated RAMP protein, Cmr4 family [Thermodesulfatator indicus DSM 15286]|uniref:CRISPR-associated RAMP protein, Cmr4 family n=1 Tax=Thermodesulfatator indicus (strain DSM 15286 / JCM 11887 / CIR29812) TaxID=667014 RepID=F8A9G5_THEID|nr:type III-B CRISPR module RAMP protein Cmr4 [Thermodesulfatator indicus]AEH44107.1 CRISPR-associated RAMP protein, Cmr4 family [Thermodesulfatator indicus DSM 15286]
MYKTHRFLIMTTDPVHIGTGGMRLGRVDNTIVREPGTRLPKIPGTALHGAIRAYAARRYGKPQCAGQGSTEGRKHCGRPTCPICYTFGSIQGEAGSFSGVVSISDARILLFPVYSMVGPVWVSTVGILKEAGFDVSNPSNNSEVKEDEFYSTMKIEKPISLGWLMVDPPKAVEINPPKDLKQWENIKNRIVLVSDKLFSQIVNSNLEVRTSVAINPETGATEEGALYTYEAIPRATFLWFDVVVDDFRGTFPTVTKLSEWENILKNEKEEAKKGLLKKWKLLSDKEDKEEKEKFQKAVKKVFDWINEERFKDVNLEKWKWDNIEATQNNQNILRIIVSGLEWAEHLGIGGMGTRGFGRIKQVVDPWEVQL